MSYQVLARKWRPRRFAEMVGQEHVVQALTNALDNDRLHHAYLFSGTRGVGKTTLARIFAKSLNCEQGVSANPCGECGVCREIDEGRFVDLLEVDAASRTKVDQTRELLDNVPYAPVRGRYKVYLIDEVHMFSASSFNALLKTLEEPPPHVKFLLATTDPQKMPLTVLSRCLQFNLKRLPLDQIAGQLRHILDQEQITHEASALRLLARAADGSMRDGLSLLDQAIAFGGGEVKETDIRTMLGTLASGQVYALAEALATGDAAALLTQIARMAELAPDFPSALQELLGLLHQLALVQAVPGLSLEQAEDADAVTTLAERLSPEDVQLYYQIGLLGQRDLPLAPDPRSGFEMTLLRMLAFRPAQVSSTAGAGTPAKPAAAPGKPATAPGQTKAASSPPAPPARPQAQTSAAAVSPEPLNNAEDWHRLSATLKLGGVARQLADNCTFDSWDGQTLALTMDPVSEHMRVASAEERLLKALQNHINSATRLHIRVQAPQSETPAQRASRERQERQRQAEQAIANDPLVKSLEENFSAQVESGSVKPVDS